MGAAHGHRLHYHGHSPVHRWHVSLAHTPSIIAHSLECVADVFRDVEAAASGGR